ncbi:MAG: R3H domain-containing nucleic acid-binding protein [Propionibacterium sp.]
MSDEDTPAVAENDVENDVVDKPVDNDVDETREDSSEPAEVEDAAEDSEDSEEEILVKEGDVAADYLEELLDIADLDGDLDSYTEGDRAHVSIDTESTTLVGRDGQVLEALQELCRLAVMTQTGHRSRLMLDVAGHRDKRRKELQLLAQDAVNSVNANGEPVRLAPMNPFERKVVHDAVAAAGLHSESEGQEPQRRVVVEASE